MRLIHCTGFVAAVSLGMIAHAQETQKAAPRPSSRNIEQLLQEPVTVIGDDVAIKQLFTTLAHSDADGINIVVNWAALAEAGVTRETPISLHLHDVSVEDAIRAILIAAPATASQLNYVVSAGVIEITTNAEIGKHTETRFHDLTAPLKDPLAPTPDDTQRTADQALLKSLVLRELLRIGERVDGPARDVSIKENALAATTSARGQAAIRHSLDLLSRPTRPGQFPPGTAVSVAQKKAEQSLNALLNTAVNTLVSIAKHPSTSELKTANLSTLLLPGTDDQLRTPTPALSCYVNSAGIILIGPAATTHPPILLAVYDLRDLLKRLAIRSGSKPPRSPSELTADLLSTVKSKPPSLPWGDLEKAEMSLTPYHESLIVFAPAPVQREVSAALQELNK